MADTPPPQPTSTSQSAPGRPESVEVGQRYAAAWAEINARLVSRQNVQIGFIAASWAIIGATLARWAETPTAFDWLGLLLPLLAWAFALWSCNHDAMIGLLSSFCGANEDWNNSDLEKKRPAWHSGSQNLMESGLRLRRWTDWAFIIALGASSLPAAIRVSAVIASGFWAGVVVTVLVVAALGAAAFVHRGTRRRRRIRQEVRYDPSTGHWTVPDFLA